MAQGEWTSSDCYDEIANLIASAESQLDEGDVIEVLIYVHDLVSEKMIEHGVTLGGHLLT
jgi:hypothetical protein